MAVHHLLCCFPDMPVIVLGSFFSTILRALPLFRQGKPFRLSFWNFLTRFWPHLRLWCILLFFWFVIFACTARSSTLLLVGASSFNDHSTACGIAYFGWRCRFLPHIPVLIRVQDGCSAVSAGGKGNESLFEKCPVSNFCVRSC